MHKHQYVWHSLHAPSWPDMNMYSIRCERVDDTLLGRVDWSVSFISTCLFPLSLFTVFNSLSDISLFLCFIASFSPLSATYTSISLSLVQHTILFPSPLSMCHSESHFFPNISNWHFYSNPGGSSHLGCSSHVLSPAAVIFTPPSVAIRQLAFYLPHSAQIWNYRFHFISPCRIFCHLLSRQKKFQLHTAKGLHVARSLFPAVLHEHIHFIHSIYSANVYWMSMCFRR